jgi:hemerythrin-like domain-containing protein
MLPAGPLMKEHRLIERLIISMEKELGRMKRDKTADVVYIDKAVDFIRVYADRCHHGKEEEILFKSLSEKICRMSINE